MRRVLAFAGLILALPVGARAATIGSFVLFGGTSAQLGQDSTINDGLVGSNGFVQVGAMSDTLTLTGGGALSALGNDATVASMGDVIFNGNVSLNGGSHVTGDVDSGGNVTIGTNAIVDGDVRAKGTVSLLAGAHVLGSVDSGSTANVAISLGNNAKVDGAATHKSGTNVNLNVGASVGSNVLAASPAAPLPYSTTVLPGASIITTGLGNTIGNANSNFTLAPGQYGKVDLGQTSVLNLSAGDYAFTSWDLNSGSTLNLDLGGGNLRVFLTGNGNIGQNFVVNITGGDASNVYFETLGDWKQNSSGQWKGTLFASGADSDVSFGTNTTLEGQAWATKNAECLANCNATLVAFDPTGPVAAPVPEPGTVGLLGAGLLALVLHGRRRNRRG